MIILNDIFFELRYPLMYCTMSPLPPRPQHRRHITLSRWLRMYEITQWSANPDALSTELTWLTTAETADSKFSDPRIRRPPPPDFGGEKLPKIWHSFRTTVPTLTLTLEHKDFGTQTMALWLGLGSVGCVWLVGWVGFSIRAKIGLGLGLGTLFLNDQNFSTYMREYTVV